ncbi:hypothetical protein RISK_006321 [Rhodopirellula islandica]|uniref:Uncharacterized protein n=2 Tax=Rhodopirellula islandica TaxID=595434 RepID=A0A0J1B426_RHOIS|nr:hypothetical protein RISK_006321 [Rhodopirellula islandica]
MARKSLGCLSKSWSRIDQDRNTFSKETSMSVSKDSPQVGDIYRCVNCQMEIHVTKGCDCEGCEPEFRCCGKPLEKVTEPPAND